ncbi:winged helix-turn-helix transcriptional regulator [Planctomycetaceae bacterium SH139]
MAENEIRADCPVASALDLLGDRWTLLVVRDIVLSQRFAYTEIGADEGIATNVLSNRLERLVCAEVIEQFQHPTDKRRRAYLPTEKGISLVRILVELLVWGDAHTSATSGAEFAAAIRKDREAMIAHLEAKARQSVEAFHKQQ